MSGMETLMADAERRVQRVAANAAEDFSHLPRTEAITAMYADLEGSDVSRDQLCTTATILLRRLPEELARAERNRPAWTSARQRAAGHLAALIEADEERDYLRGVVRQRDYEVAELAARLAEFSGITS